MSAPDTEAVISYLLSLQDAICDALELEDGTGKFLHDDWERAVALAGTIKSEELLELPAQEILHRLFHEDDLRLFETEPLAFRCSCSHERVGNMLKSLGAEQVHEILAEEPEIEVGCEFCHQKYRFDKVDAEQLFAAEVSHPAPKQSQ